MLICLLLTKNYTYVMCLMVVTFLQEDKNITQIFKDLVENMDTASAGGGSKPKKAAEKKDDSKGFGSDEKGDAPATKDEGSKGGGCKCSIQ